MGREKPAESGAMPEYKAHYELWNEASAPEAIGASVAGSGRSYRALAIVAAVGAVIAFLAIRPWTPRKASSPTAGNDSAPTTKAAASAIAMPPVAITAQSETAPSARAEVAVKPPIEPAASPSPATSRKPSRRPQLASVQSSDSAPDVREPASEVPAASAATARSDNETEDLSPSKKQQLETSIRKDLAREEFSAVSVAVGHHGDVFLTGSFLNRADKDRAIAMVRSYVDAGDIYFSGAVWHEQPSPAQQARAPGERSER
jgi:hypothetical protein